MKKILITVIILLSLFGCEKFNNEATINVQHLNGTITQARAKSIHIFYDDNFGYSVNISINNSFESISSNYQPTLDEAFRVAICRVNKYEEIRHLLRECEK
jgi:hypothetical protein